MLKKAELWLRKGADRRLRGGHCWVYSNEIDSARSPLSAFSAGDTVRLHSQSGEVLGTALMEPKSLICARVFSRDADADFDKQLCLHKLGNALALRQQFYDAPYYRLVYGDSDGLSGVVIDRFADYFVVQLNTAGAECHEASLVEALVELFKPAGILLRCDSRARRDQGLDDRIEVIYGDCPDELPLQENDTRFLAPVLQGQKTGWFYDHRENRARMQSLCAGRTVLDVYSYIGGWGIEAAAAGASHVDCIDSSDYALQYVQKNADLNGVGEKVSTHCGRADQLMQELAAQGRRFHIVVIDPPAFIPRKRDQGKGKKAYRRINELALQLVESGGVLISASCSMHLSQDDLLDVLRGAALRSACDLQLAHLGGQGADHPIAPAIQETRYLKAAFARVSRAE